MTSTNKLCKLSEALRRKTNLGKEAQPWHPLKSTVYNNVFNLQILLYASAVKILRRGGKNTQKNFTQKGLNDSYNHDGVIITHLEPDILECEVKWALGSITINKASEGDGMPVELFQILKDDAVKYVNMPANLENSAVATGLENVSFHSNPKERKCQRMFKLMYSCAHFTW